MMNQKKECKIIYDLLPNYIDNLTSNETNEYIQDHLKICPKCSNILKDMQEKVNLEKIDTNNEIKVLKKVKRRIRLQIILAIVFITTIFSIGLYINNNYSFYRNEQGKLSIKSYNSKITVSNLKYVIIKAKKEKVGTKDGYVYITQILTINEKNKCTNMRYIEDGYTNEKLQDLYTKFKDNESLEIHTNIEIKDEKLYYNANSYNGKSKDEIISEMNTYYDEIEYVNEI